MEATPEAVARAVGDPTTETEIETETETETLCDQPRETTDGKRIGVDEERDEIDVLELPDDWTETDLTDETVEIEGVDFE